MSVTSRRKPWPYDLLINGRGVRLLPDESGTALIGKKVLSLANVVPTDQAYGKEDLYRERSYAFRRPALGLGERIQTTASSPRYRYALNAWFAGGLRGKGPLWHNLAPASTGEVRDFPEALNAGVLTQFVLAGRYCLRRTDDTVGGQLVSKDFGAGRQAQAAVRWKNAGTGLVDGLFVALDNSELWRYDGAVWAQMGTAVTIPAQFLATVGDELWRGWGNQVSKCTADPSVAGNWAAPITVGDASSSITALATVDNLLFIFKDNGSVFTVNGDGTDNELGADLRTTVASTNGLNAASWLGALWFRNGDSFWRLTPAGSGVDLTQVGPERMAENDSEVRGPVTCAAGYGAWAGYWGVYNNQNGASYLLQFGDWLPPGEGGEERYRFAEVLNGALLKWAGRRITALRVSTLVATGGGNPRLYAGFADGSFGWVLLPKNTPNPFANGSGCEFADGSLGPSECYWPTHTMLAPADTKVFLSFTADGPVLDAGNNVRLGYAADSATGVPVYATLGNDLTSRGVPVSFPSQPTGRSIDVKETYQSPSSASTPVVETVVLREALRPALRIEYAGTIDARPRVARRDGATDRKTPEQIRALVSNAAAVPGSVTLVMPDESVQGFAFVNYGEALPAAARRAGLAWALPVSFVQFQTLSTYGTWDRAAAYTWDDLLTWDWDSVRTI